MTKHSAKAKPAARTRQSKPGELTLQGILSQPRVWSETETRLREVRLPEKFSELFSPRSPWLFVGCGSSYYLSRLIAALWTKHFYIPATACPFLSRSSLQETLRRRGRTSCMMSRSGETTEVLRAAELLRKHPTVQTRGLPAIRKPAGNVVHALFKLTGRMKKHGDDSVLHAILLAFQRLGLHPWATAVLRRARSIAPARAGMAGRQCQKDQEFTSRKNLPTMSSWARARISLAQSRVEITEMSSSYAQVYHSLIPTATFRRRPNTLITFFISKRQPRRALLVKELKELGGICDCESAAELKKPATR